VQLCSKHEQLLINEVEYVGKKQIVKIEQLATKQDNNNLKHIFAAYILGREVLENSSGRTVSRLLANLSFIYRSRQISRLQRACLTLCMSFSKLRPSWTGEQLLV
jgi:nitrogenase molybdenum-iron protein alpha/beta subunit